MAVYASICRDIRVAGFQILGGGVQLELLPLPAWVTVLSLAVACQCQARAYPGHRTRMHLRDPCHPDIECRTFDIERHIRYRRLQHRMRIRYRRFAPSNLLASISYVDIEGVRHRRSNDPISKGTNLWHWRSWIGLSIPRFHVFNIEYTSFDIACW